GQGGEQGEVRSLPAAAGGRLRRPERAAAADRRAAGGVRRPASLPGDGAERAAELRGREASAATAADPAGAVRPGPDADGAARLHGGLRGPLLQRAVPAGRACRGGARLLRGSAGMARGPGGGAAPAPHPATAAAGPASLRGRRRRAGDPASAAGADGPAAAGDPRAAGGAAARGPLRRPGGGEPMSTTNAAGPIKATNGSAALELGGLRQ